MSIQEIKESINDNVRLFEIVIVMATAISKFFFMDYLNHKLFFIIITIATWVIYIVYRHRMLPGILAYWGFRIDNFKLVAKKILPFGFVSILLVILIGYLRNTLNISWHIIPILILYPIWGTIQQFLTIGIFASNFQDMKKKTYSDFFIIVTTATLFSAVHYPYYWLMFGTFALGIFYTYIYLRHRNLYVLGLFHGLLGGIFFYTVVNRDPFIEVFGKYLSN